MYKRIKQLLDSVANKEEKKIILICQGKKYTLEEYAKKILPEYVIVKKQELYINTENGYIRLEEFFIELIEDYKRIIKSDELAKTPITKRPNINDNFKEIVQNHPKLTNLIYDDKYMLKILKQSNNPMMIWYNMAQKFREDKTFMLKAISINPDNYYYADPELKRDKKFAIECVNIDGILLKHMEGTYNVDISYEPDIDSLGNVYNTAERHYTHKNDCEVVFAAVLQNPESIQYAIFDNFKINNKDIYEESTEYTNQVKEIMIYVISQNPALYEYTPELLKNDESIIKEYNTSKKKIKTKRRCR